MRKLALGLVLILLGTVAFAQEDNNKAENPMADWEMVGELSLTGIGPLNFGWVAHNDQGQVKSVRGINVFTLGYGAKHYFGAAETGTFNPYWAWGTAALIVPSYIFVGGDYVTRQGIFFGAGIGIPWLYAEVGIYF